MRRTLDRAPEIANGRVDRKTKGRLIRRPLRLDHFFAARERIRPPS